MIVKDLIKILKRFPRQAEIQIDNTDTNTIEIGGSVNEKNEWTVKIINKKKDIFTESDIKNLS